MKTRVDKIKEYGLSIVESDEKYWLELGYKVNYATGRLDKISNNSCTCNNIKCDCDDYVHCDCEDEEY